MKSPTRLFSAVFVSAAVSILAMGCGSGGTSDGTHSEVATSAIGGSSSASEGTVAFNLDPHQRPSYFARLGDALSPISTSWAVPSCNWSSLLSSCTTAGAETLSYGSCSLAIDPAIKISGSQTLSWTAANCCTSTPLSAAAGCSFTRRTINASGAADPIVRSVGSNSVTLNTEDSSGYASAKTGGFSVTCQGLNGTNTCDAQRQIAIAGAHYTGQSGRAQWDHTVSTDQALVVQGDGASRKVVSGIVRVQNNLDQTSSTSTITATLTHTAGCCYPTGGTLSTTFSGGKLDGKTETLTYGPGCGDATLNTTDQKQTGLTLHHCL